MSCSLQFEALESDPIASDCAEPILGAVYNALETSGEVTLPRCVYGNYKLQGGDRPRSISTVWYAPRLIHERNLAYLLTALPESST